MSRFRALYLPLIAAALVAGCGSSSHASSTAASASASSSSAGATVAAVGQLASAEHPQRSLFPAPSGRTLQQMAGTVKAGAMLGAATGSFTPGTRRFAFALNTSDGAFVYAPTALYVARRAGAPAQGPFLAPADPLGVAPAFRSKQNMGPGGIKAIYAADLPLPAAGTYLVLALTRGAGGLSGATGEIAVAAHSPIPGVGQRPPAIATATTGSISQLTTRIPPESMHSVSFRDVLGRRPIALLISTPQLCTSRVCGPVTDIAVSLQQRFGSQVAFIHQEVYVDNQPSKGLRPQMKAFGLQTEPWLFTINRQGRIAARLEGSFGVNAFTAALQAALR